MFVFVGNDCTNSHNKREKWFICSGDFIRMFSKIGVRGENGLH
jgi:hypothetical protein